VKDEVLEKVQRRATKCVSHEKQDNQQRLQQLGLTTLNTRRIRGYLIETVKILTAKEGVDLTVKHCSSSQCPIQIVSPGA